MKRDGGGRLIYISVEYGADMNTWPISFDRVR
jgi:hypothetical protein